MRDPTRAFPKHPDRLIKISLLHISQGWGSFLRNHAPHIAAMDLFVVPTIGLNLLYVLVIVRLARRELVGINVTAHPTAEWPARTAALPRDYGSSSLAA